MPADLGQFGRKYSCGALIGWKGFIKLGHMAANGGRFIDKIDLKTASGKIKRGLNTADTSTNNHYVPEIVAPKTFTELFNLFSFHTCTRPYQIPFLHLKRVHP